MVLSLACSLLAVFSVTAFRIGENVGAGYRINSTRLTGEDHGTRLECDGDRDVAAHMLGLHGTGDDLEGPSQPCRNSTGANAISSPNRRRRTRRTRTARTSHAPVTRGEDCQGHGLRLALDFPIYFIRREDDFLAGPAGRSTLPDKLSENRR
jgi:hypothetical protein